MDGIYRANADPNSPGVSLGLVTICSPRQLYRKSLFGGVPRGHRDPMGRWVASSYEEAEGGGGGGGGAAK